MIWEAWFALAVVVFLLTGLSRNRAVPDLLVPGSLVPILVTGELAGTEALPGRLAEATAGFANPANGP